MTEKRWKTKFDTKWKTRQFSNCFKFNIVSRNVSLVNFFLHFLLKSPLKVRSSLRAHLRHDFEAIPANRHRLSTVVSWQGDSLVDAPRAENFAAPETVCLFHFLWERRRTGTNCSTTKAFPIERNRIDFVGDLICFAAVCFRHRQSGEGEFGGL